MLATLQTLKLAALDSLAGLPSGNLPGGLCQRRTWFQKSLRGGSTIRLRIMVVGHYRENGANRISNQLRFDSIPNQPVHSRTNIIETNQVTAHGHNGRHNHLHANIRSVIASVSFFFKSLQGFLLSNYFPLCNLRSKYSSLVNRERSKIA
jgi:hypothetical protein